MAKFGHLKKLEIGGDATRVYRFAGIAGTPTLTCASATKANRPYWLALLALGQSQAKRADVDQSPEAVARRAQENREENARLFTAHCIRSWSGVVDEDGKDVPLTAEDCAAFLLAIPVSMFDEFTMWIATASIFRATPLEPEAAAKN